MPIPVRIPISNQPQGSRWEDFLTEGAQSLIDNFVTELEMEVDGVSLQNPFKYRATSSLFIFTAHPSVIPVLGIPCLTGSPQPAVADGYWVDAEAPLCWEPYVASQQ